MGLRAEIGIAIPVPSGIGNILSGVFHGAGRNRVLPVVYVSQRPYRNLCWAACGEMALATVRRSIPMCQFASWRSGQSCCANDLMVPACDQTCWPEYAYDSLEFSYRIAGGPLNRNSLIDELANHGRPVQMVLEYPGWLHTALVVGIAADGDFVVHDPWFGEHIKGTYEMLLRAYGSRTGAWNLSYHSLGA